MPNGIRIPENPFGPPWYNPVPTDPMQLPRDLDLGVKGVGGPTGPMLLPMAGEGQMSWQESFLDQPFGGDWTTMFLGQTGGGGEEEDMWEPFGEEFPTLELPRYGEFGQAFPESTLPIYSQFGQPYPGLGPLYEQSEDVIGALLRGEVTKLPIEELMGAYTAEEQAALKEYMPELREYWAGKGLLRSGMEMRREGESAEESARRRATYRAGLGKESAIREQEGVITGLGMAMQHLGLGYGVARDAWQAARGEHVAEFQSKVQNSQFVQGIQERAYGAARDEHQRVYASALGAGRSEWEAKTLGWQAYQSEYARIQQMEYGEFMFQLQADLERELAEMGYDSQTTQSIWGSIGTILGSVFMGLLL